MEKKINMLEKEIIKKVRKGDRKAFDSLCSELYGGLISYARIFLPEEWAEDVVQDVFFSVWQNRARLDENAAVDSYIFRAVRNAALNFLKLQQHADNYREWNYNRIAAIALSSVDPEKNTILKRLYDGDLRKKINEAVSALPARQREIFRLSYVEEMTSKEIAGKLGISSRTVESHLYEAVRHLRGSLSEESLSAFIYLTMISAFFSGLD